MPSCAPQQAVAGQPLQRFALPWLPHMAGVRELREYYFYPLRGKILQMLNLGRSMRRS